MAADSRMRPRRPPRRATVVVARPLRATRPRPARPTRRALARPTATTRATIRTPGLDHRHATTTEEHHRRRQHGATSRGGTTEAGRRPGTERETEATTGADTMHIIRRRSHAGRMAGPMTERRLLDRRLLLLIRHRRQHSMATALHIHHRPAAAPAEAMVIRGIERSGVV